MLEITESQIWKAGAFWKLAPATVEGYIWLAMKLMQFNGYELPEKNFSFNAETGSVLVDLDV